MEEAPPPYDAGATTDGAAATKEGGTSIGLNLGFIKTPPGVLLIVNIVLLFLSWVIMAGWRGEVNWWVEEYYAGRTGFYLASTVIPWLVFIVLFVLMMFNLHARISRVINFPLTIMINCVIWAVLLFIASCMVADMARKHNSHSSVCEYWKCGHLGACAAFGFFSVLGMGIQAFLHFREWRNP